MIKEAYSFSIYYDFGFFSRKKAWGLIETIIKNSPKAIDQYGISESKLIGITPEAKTALQNIATDYPRYYSGKLFLFSKKKEITIMIDHFVIQPTVVTVFIKPNKLSLDKISDFFSIMADDDHVIFGGLDTIKNITQRHTFIKEYEDWSEEERMGENFENGIPGLYKKTFFNYGMVTDLKLTEKISSNLTREVRSGFLFDFEKDEIKKCIQIIGENYFFDVSEPEKVKKLPPSIKMRIEKLKMTDIRTVPSYTMDIPYVDESNDKTKIENFYKDNGLTDLAMSLEELDFKFDRILENNTDADIHKIIILCGNYLAKYFSNKLNAAFNGLSGVELERNGKPYIINTFNCMALKHEDKMKLNDFYQFIKMFFMIK